MSSGPNSSIAAFWFQYKCKLILGYSSNLSFFKPTHISTGSNQVKLSLVTLAPQLHVGQHSQAPQFWGSWVALWNNSSRNKSTDTLSPAFTNTEQSLAGLPSQVQDNPRVVEICWLWQTVSFLWKVGLWGATGQLCSRQQEPGAHFTDSQNMLS